MQSKFVSELSFMTLNLTYKDCKVFIGTSCIVPHRVHGAIGIVYKYHFYWRSFACFVPSISAIFDTISTHKLSHKRASLWQQDVYFIIIHSCRIFIEGWFKKEKRWVSFCAKCMFNDVVFFSSAMNRYKRKGGGGQETGDSMRYSTPKEQLHSL